MGFAEPLQFHSALAARHPAESSPVAILRLCEPLLIRPTLADDLQLQYFPQRRTDKSAKRFVILYYENPER
jgi:hypothetical protein